MGTRRRRFASSFEPVQEAQSQTLQLQPRRSRRRNMASSSSSSTYIRDPSKVSSLQNFSLYSQQRPQHETAHSLACDETSGCDDITENIYYFIIPEGKTEETVSSHMKSAYEQCFSLQFLLHWAKEEDAESINYERGSIFILERFEGRVYKYFERTLAKKKNFMIIGPLVLCYMFHHDVKQFFHGGYPIFTLAMLDVVVSSTGIRDHGKKESLISLVLKMGGQYDGKYVGSLTHMVSLSMISEKSVIAKQRKVPVMKVEWVEAVWNRSLTNLIHGTDPEFAHYECPMFHNLIFCFSQISLNQKQILQKTVEANGGAYTPDLIRKKSNMLVLVKGEGDKFRHASSWGVNCIRPDWIKESVDKGYAICIREYVIHSPDQPLSSTLAGSEIKFPDMSTCSTIRGNTSLTPINSTEGSSRFQLDSMLMSANRDIATPLPPKGFLGGCKIFLSGVIGFNEAKNRLLNSGATVENRLDESITHIVVIEDVMPEADFIHLNDLNSKPYVVRMDWITESVSQKSRAYEDIFKFKLPILKPPEPVNFLEPEILPPVETESSEEHKKSGSSGGMDNFHESNRMLNTSNPETPQPIESVFTRMKFYLAFQNDPIGQERAVEAVTNLGGFVVTENWDFIIATPVHVDKSILTHPHYTEFWLMDCDEQGSVDIPLLLHHKPLLWIPAIEKLMEGVCLAISSYPAERLYLSAVASHMGAIVQDVFAKKKKNDILSTTHLICGTKESDKYQAAIRWRIPVVTCHWIVESYSRQRILNSEDFAIGVEMEDSISDIFMNTPMKSKQPFASGLESTSIAYATIASAPQSCFTTAINKRSSGLTRRPVSVSESCEVTEPRSRQVKVSKSNEVSGPNSPPVTFVEPNEVAGPSSGTVDIEFTGVGGAGTFVVTPVRHPRLEAVAGRKLSIGSETGSPPTQKPKFATPPYVCEYKLDASYDFPLEEFRKQIYFSPQPSPETPKLHAELFECMRKYCRGELNPSVSPSESTNEKNAPIDIRIRPLANESKRAGCSNEKVETRKDFMPPCSSSPIQPGGLTGKNLPKRMKNSFN